MLGYVSNGNGYLVIDIEEDENGKPIIPEGATITPPPIPTEEDNFTLTIENGQWVKHPIVITEEMRFIDESLLKKAQFEAWKDRYLNRPFIYDGFIYKNDSRFREMLNSAIAAYSEWGILPNFWITADDNVIEPVTKKFLDDLGKFSYEQHQESLLTILKIGKSIQNAKTTEDLEVVILEEIPTIGMLQQQLKKEVKK